MQLSPRILKLYQRRLTNLTSRNRSLLLTTLPAEQFLDLHETDFLLNQPSFDIIRQLIARKTAIPLGDVLDPRLEKSNEVSKKLRRIARTERFIEEERGAEDLYVAYPFVRGKLNDGTVIHAPLVFFPVTLQQRGNRWVLVRRADESIVLNRSLLLAYAYYNQIQLSDDWLERSLDDLDTDATAFRTGLYELLKESPLELAFNPDIFTDKLQWFDKLKKSDLDVLERSGELRIHPEAVLGIFPQAGSYLVPDYEKLLEKGGEEERRKGEEENKLSNSPFPPFLPSSLSPLLKEEHIHTPLPLDASQEEALRRVKAGESLVVQGPPGTGKSQLIGNLMADFAAQGKRVLLVCQKRVALDVVHERLRQVGMEPFTALIHDFKNDRRTLYYGLAQQIERIDEYKRQNGALDAILLERTFDQQCRRIDQTLAELQAFREALFDESLFGVSVKELYLSSDPKAASVPLGELYLPFRKAETDALIEKLRDYQGYRQRIAADSPWKERVSFARFTLSDQRAIRQTIDEVAESVRKLTDESQALFGVSLTWAQAQVLTNSLPTLRSLPDHVADPTVWALLRRFVDPAAFGDNRLTDELNSILQAFAQEPPRIRHPLAELPMMAQRLQAGLSARSSFFNWLFYKDKAFVRDLAGRHGLSDSSDDLHRLNRQLVHQQYWYERLDSLTHRLGLPSVLSADPAETGQRITQLSEAFRQASDVWQSIQNRFPFLTGWLLRTEKRLDFQEGIWQLTGWLENVQQKTTRWQTYLTPGQIETLSRQPDMAASSLLRSLDSDFDLMAEADRLHEGMADSEKKVLQRLLTHDDPNLASLFANSIRLAWIEHIEERQPELRGVSSLKISQLEEALQESVQKKQELSQQILLTQLREQTYKNLEYNRLNNRVTYRDLHHQVTKKRNVWPIRKLMEAFADEVFRLVPCWMASPESVSAIFPMQPDLFDLIIFDEASQCYAENGIPALYRARQVVVTGDSQQLQPSDLYRIRYDEQQPDEEIVPEAEIESLLDLAARYFPQTALRGHYRSQLPELIQFSNRQFYRHKLHLLPDFHHLNHREPAIRYLHVDGIWQSNTNEAEARFVVDLIAQLQQELPNRSIGVVTFNAPQQSLIQDLLEPLPQATGVFVKNIENVQGDERDVIIFSVGYAPDVRGRVSAQFGSLNAKGGENRLNVAITRARERIYVVTSLWPHQLPVDNTLNEGPKLLRDYLAFAQEVSEGRHRPRPHVPEGLPGNFLLKDRLANPAAGLVEELPFGDLTQKEGEQYKSLLLTDDALYYESTTKDAHAYTPLLLRRRHWPFERVYSREFWRKGFHPSDQIDKS